MGGRNVSAGRSGDPVESSGPRADRFAELTHGGADWAGLRVVVAGIGVSGFAAADALLERGAHVVVVDSRQDEPQRERGIVLDTLGADIRLGPEAVEGLPTVAGW
jgi:UDP-N-acetylmuramoylalanine--D-glutamate ligase